MFNKTLFTESKILILLALPLIGSGVVELSVGFFSTLFLAHLSQEALAAGALVAWLFATLMVIVWGLLSAVSTLVSRYHGEQNHQKISSVLRDGLLTAAILALPAAYLLWNIAPILLLFGQKPEAVKLAQPYLHGLAWAIIPDFIICVLLHFVSGLGRTKVNLTFSVLWVPLNIFLNYSMMFGKFGLSNLGIAGIGWGTAASYWITTIGFVIYLLISPAYKKYHLKTATKINWHSFKELLQVGLPLGFMYSVEIGFFLAVSLMMGKISADALGGNQITLQYLWIFSMVTFCTAQAITIRMGHTIGASDIKKAELAGYIGIFWNVIFMILVAFIYWFAPNALISLDFDIHNPNNQTTVTLAKEFLALAAIVQIIEAIRFGAFGALRALKDTRFTMYASIFTFWILAIPLGYALAFNFNMLGNGIWWAMIFSQVVGAIIMIWRYRVKIRDTQAALSNRAIRKASLSTASRA